MAKFLKIINLETVDSTNDYAFKLAGRGAKEITIVSAKEQMKGKGRFGRYWSSPKNTGIYISFILYPKKTMADLCLLPLFFSLGVARVLKGIVEAGIKCPNDIMVAGKKISGVLVEAKTVKKNPEFVIAGIGLNINSKSKDIPETATSLFLETNKTYDLEKIKKQLINEELAIYKDFTDNKQDLLLREVDKIRLNSFTKADMLGGICLR